MKLSLSVSWHTYQPGTYGTLRCNCLVLVCKSEQKLCFIDWVTLRDIYKVAIIFSEEDKRKLKGVISTMSFALLSKMMSLFQTAGSQITKAFYYIAIALCRPLCGCWCSICMKNNLRVFTFRSIFYDGFKNPVFSEWVCAEFFVIWETSNNHSINGTTVYSFKFILFVASEKKREISESVVFGFYKCAGCTKSPRLV